MYNDGTEKSLAVILLAAGESSRLGEMKQLVKIEGTTLIEKQLRLSLKISNEVYCVLGYQAEEIYKHIDHLPITTMINSDWKRGLGSSIAKGVSALPAYIDSVLLLLVDQWQLTPCDFTAYLQTWARNSDKIIIAHADDKRGPPVIFPRQYFSELGKLDDKDGARTLLKKYNSNVEGIHLPSAFIDLDTPEQLIAMQQQTN